MPNSILLTWSKHLFTPLALLALLIAAWQTRNLLIDLLNRAQLIWISLSIIAWISAHLLTTFATYLLLKTCHLHIPYPIILSIHLHRLPARYLPGGIWHTVGRMVDFHNQGAQSKQLSNFVILENGLAVGTAFLFSCPLIYHYRDFQDFWVITAISAGIGSLLGLILLPYLLNWQRWYATIAIDKVLYSLSILFYLPIWIALSAAFISYLMAFPHLLDQVALLEVIGVYLFSWGTGFLVIFAPQGIGIFEVMAGHLLTIPLSLTELAVLIAGFRVCALIGDGMLWGIHWLFKTNR